jgi:PRTRC genetic system protein B
MKPVIVRGTSMRDYKLSSALLLYTSAGGYGDAYATIHAVRNSKGAAPAIGAGIPLTESALRQALANLGAPKGLGGWISPAMLYMADDCIVWQIPPQRRPVFFRSAGKLGTAHATVPHPHLVFAVSRDHWYVAAVRFDSANPGKSALFHSPYFNCYSDGSVCIGNVPRPKRLEPSTLGDFERAFFNSYFTHSNNQNVTTHPDGPDGLWGEMLAGAHVEFPGQYLAPMNLTLDKWVKKIAKG